MIEGKEEREDMAGDGGRGEGGAVQDGVTEGREETKRESEKRSQEREWLVKKGGAASKDKGRRQVVNRKRRGEERTRMGVVGRIRRVMWEKVGWAGKSSRDFPTFIILPPRKSRQEADTYRDAPQASPAPR